MHCLVDPFGSTHLPFHRGNRNIFIRPPSSPRFSVPPEPTNAVVTADQRGRLRV